MKFICFAIQCSTMLHPTELRHYEYPNDSLAFSLKQALKL